MNNSALIRSLNKDLAIELPERITLEEIKRILGTRINELIRTDFNKLVYLLYRIDVSESKLKYLLKKTAGEDAGDIIAALIIERQLMKIRSRKEFKHPDTNIPDEDKW